MSTVKTDNQHYQSIANAIRSKNGEETTYKPSEMAQAILDIPTGIAAADFKDVNFYDYDGTIVYSYTYAEFSFVTELPANPKHDGLIAQGWNWTLAQIKSYISDYPEAIVNVGQMYITDDGKTRLYLTIEDLTYPETTIAFGCTEVGGVTIDWGDGSPTETSTATALTSYNHNYAATGNYVVTLEVTSGTMTWNGTTGSGSAGIGMMGNRTNATNNFNLPKLRKVEMGSGITAIGAFWFAYCKRLMSITIPNGITNIGASTFNYVDSLYMIAIPISVSGISSTNGSQFTNSFNMIGALFPAQMISLGNNMFQGDRCFGTITIPNGITRIPTSFFNGANLIKRIAIPNSVTTIAGSAFSQAMGLPKITIPASVTSIEANAFYYCVSMKEIRFKGSVPPTVANSNAFSNFPSDCVIYVPSGSLSAYTSATNYPSSSTYTYVEY